MDKVKELEFLIAETNMCHPHFYFRKSSKTWRSTISTGSKLIEANSFDSLIDLLIATIKAKRMFSGKHYTLNQ